MTNRYSITTKEYGRDGGDSFSDIASAGDLNTAAIARIVVGFRIFLFSLTVHYVGSEQPAVTHGGTASDQHEIVLNEDEWITEIECTVASNDIESIKFVNNKGKSWGPFGGIQNKKFVLNPVELVPAYIASRMGLIYLQGRSNGVYIQRLGATFAEYPPYEKPPVLFKFEEQTDSGNNAPSAGIFSTFARQLMSPIITLRIGPDNIQYRAFEDLLCRLPFFKAALQGGFNEASEKAITMPDDEPATIAALIEFLSTGSYTYAFNTEGTDHPETADEPVIIPDTADVIACAPNNPDMTSDIPDTAVIPVRNINEGFFHLAVYATAFKYDCKKLAQGSLRNFISVLKQMKGLDGIKLWRAAYLKGVYLSQFKPNHNVQFCIQGLHQLVGDAYTTHREEMERIVSEDPALANDLLRLITTTKSEL